VFLLYGFQLNDSISFAVDVLQLIVFPLITFLLGWFVHTIHKKWKFRTFNSVFGKVARDPENLIISIPLWKLKEGPSNTVRFQKTGLTGEIEEEYGPDDTVSYDDLKASAQVAAILAEFFPKPITYSLDNDRRLELVDKTIILIGAPLANIRARGVFEILGESPLDYLWQEETADHPARHAICETKTEETFDCSGDWEYSMVLRVPNYRTLGGYFFMVSGPHAEGTLAAAIYFRNHWQEFKNAQPIAAVLLKMPRRDIAKWRVEKKFGFPEDPSIKGISCEEVGE
jgi:hypothetical protein